MNPAEYAAFDGLGLAALVRERKISIRELARAARRAIEEVNPEVRAVVEVYEEDLQLPDEDNLGEGPFRGVPFLIKDFGLRFAGRRTEFGSRLCQGLAAAADDLFAAMVHDSGVLLAGRSNTPEFSMALSAENRLFGATTNPWKAGYGTSGSSGGAAAAVAAGMVPIAHGSDMGGSIRGPAAWCGTVGLLPSRGRVSWGPGRVEGGNGMAQTFVLTRTVRDTAVMLDCLSQPQPGDPFVVWRPPHPFASYLTRPAERVRIAWSTRPLMDASVDPEVAAAVRVAAETLDGLGHEVREEAPPIDLELIDRACGVVWYFRFDRWLDQLAGLSGRKVGPDTVERATWRFYQYARGLSPESYLSSLEDFNRIRRTVGAFFSRHDVWLSPTCAQVAAPLGTYSMNVDVAPEEFLVREERPCQFMIVYNVTGQPAISLPLAQHSSGLPIGVQLGARPGEEHLLIQLAADLETRMPWTGRRPSMYASAGR